MRRRARSGCSGYPAVGMTIGKIRRHLHDGDQGEPGLATRFARGRGLSATHRVQRLTAAVAPASVRPRATIANEARTSRMRFSWIDMVQFLFSLWDAGVPVACPMWTMLR